MRGIPAGMVLLALLLFQVALVVGAEEGGLPAWEQVALLGPALLYDVDGDGYVDIVASNGTSVESVVIPTGNIQLGKTDYDGDGVLDLVIYTDEKVWIFKSSGGVERLPAPSGGVLRIQHDGFAIGDTVYGLGTYFSVPGAKPVPVVLDGHLYALYPGVNGTILRSITGEEYLIPFRGEILAAAGEGDGTIALLLQGVEGVAEIHYNIYTGNFTLNTYAIGEAVKALYSNGGFFILTSDNWAYYTKQGNVNTLSYATGMSGYTNDDHTVIFILYNITRIVSVSDEDITIISYEAPTPISGADYMDGWILVTSRDNTVYVATMELKPILQVTLPVSAIAGEPVNITVDGVFDEAKIFTTFITYKLTEPGIVTVTPEYPGNYTILIKACAKSMCVQESYVIPVKPRPLRLEIIGPKLADPYQEIELIVTPIDELTGEIVNMSCRVQYGGFSEHVILPGAITAKAIPTYSLLSEVILKCYATPYGDVIKVWQMNLTKPYIDIDFEYYGGGALYIYVYNNVTGDIIYDAEGYALVDNATQKELIVGGKVTLLIPPGNHTVTVVAMYNGIKMTKIFPVWYIPDICNTTEATGEKVIIGDRVFRETITLTKTRVTTKVKTQTQLLTITEIDWRLVIGGLVGGAGVGILAGYLILRRRVISSGIEARGSPGAPEEEALPT